MALNAEPGSIAAAFIGLKLALLQSDQQAAASMVQRLAAMPDVDMTYLRVSYPCWIHPAAYVAMPVQRHPSACLLLESICDLQVAAAEAMTSQTPSVAKLALQEIQKAAIAGPKPEQGTEAMVLRHLIIMAEDELAALQVRDTVVSCMTARNTDGIPC